MLKMPEWLKSAERKAKERRVWALQHFAKKAEVELSESEIKIFSSDHQLCVDICNSLNRHADWVQENNKLSAIISRMKK